MSFISNPGSSGPPFAESYTLATRPAANSVPAGTRIVITDALGQGGQVNSFWYSNGSIWIPFSPVLLASIDTVFTGINAGGFQYLGAVQLFAGAVEVGISLQYHMSFGFSGGGGGCTFQMRIGPSGNLTDAIAVAAAPNTFNNSFGTLYERKVVANNQLFTAGNSGNSASWNGFEGLGLLGAVTTLVGTDLSASHWVGAAVNQAFGSVIPQSGPIRVWAMPA